MTTALVLGASRGIGREFVRQLRGDGARVIATARDDAGIAALEALGAEAFKLDVADAKSAAELSWRLDGESLDLALHVAGVYTESGATEAPADADFDRVLHTNVKGAMQVIPIVAPLVESARGTFAFITSGMGSIADTASSYGWLYRVSKAALNMAVHAAAHDYPKAKLVVVNPGWVKTDMGGAGATLAVEDSIANMRRALAAVTQKDSGAFVNHDGGRYAW